MELDWTSVWEDDVADHAELAVVLARAFPHSGRIGGEQSWSSARPELRLVGRADGQVVAHAAVLRRFLQIDGRPQLVGDVGLVAVDPERHGVGPRRRPPDADPGGALRARRAVRLPDLR